MNTTQVIRQVQVVDPALSTANPTQVVERLAIFDATGAPIDLASVLADFENRITAIEGA